LTYVAVRHIVERHMVFRSRGAQVRRDRAPFLPLTPAAFHVLLALADGPKHGYLILKEVEERTAGAVRLSTGTLYGLIKRFLDDELIVELSSEGDGQERRRPYRLTPFGREVASAEAARLQGLVTAARAARLLPH
jgi:DNA-binding PadR family transcriptional regulator